MRSSLIASSCAAAALLALSIAPISLASPTSEVDAPTPSTQASSPTQTETPTPEASPSTSVPSSDGSTTASGNTPTGESVPNGEDRSATDDNVSLSPEEQIRQRWQDMGAENGVLGTATSGLVPCATGLSSSSTAAAKSTGPLNTVRMPREQESTLPTAHKDGKTALWVSRPLMKKPRLSVEFAAHFKLTRTAKFVGAARAGLTPSGARS